MNACEVVQGRRVDRPTVSVESHVVICDDSKGERTGRLSVQQWARTSTVVFCHIHAWLVQRCTFIPHVWSGLRGGCQRPQTFRCWQLWERNNLHVHAAHVCQTPCKRLTGGCVCAESDVIRRR